MFKKIISMMMVLVIVSGFTVTANAMCDSEEGRPTIIGLEYVDAIEALDGEVEIEYVVTAWQAGEYWLVTLEGESDEYEDYGAVGMYDHFPTNEEMNILWANRMLRDEILEMFDELGI